MAIVKSTGAVQFIGRMQVAGFPACYYCGSLRIEPAPHCGKAECDVKHRAWVDGFCAAGKVETKPR